MRVLTDWRPAEIWDDLNRDLSFRYLGKQAREQLRLYQGVEHAVWEVTQGLAHQYPHRRKVIHFSHQDPFHDHSILSLVRDGFDMVALDIEDLGNQERLKQEFNKECLMILYSVDEPLMGCRFAVADIEQDCEADGIFIVKVRHHDHRGQGIRPLAIRYSTEIRSYGPYLACAQLGKKVKIGSMIAPFLDWGVGRCEEIHSDLIEEQVNSQEKIEKFESSLPEGAQPMWQKKDRRSWDRAVFYWEDMDGHAVIHYLAEEMGWTLEEPGKENRVETASLSRWGGVRTMDWLKRQGLTAGQIRGSVIVHHSVIDEELKKALILAVKKVRCLQG